MSSDGVELAFLPTDYVCFEYVAIEVSDWRWSFHFRVVARDGTAINFCEAFEFGSGSEAGARPDVGVRADSDVVVRLRRLLFLAIGLSYYKTAAPERIHLAGSWDSGEVSFLEQLVRGGLAEFAFTNDLPAALTPRLTVDATHPVAPAQAIGLSPEVALTPVGGGKDSCVTIDAVARLRIEQVLFSVNDYQPIRDVAEVAGLPLVSARRVLDPTVLKLNSQGAYNGHIPVTAINSLAALIEATRLGAGMVLMSVERSASEANLSWRGLEVNHQWSKSADFESLLRDMVASIASDLQYFSVLRQYSEYRIAERFAELRAFHPVFASCGKAYLKDDRRVRWCGVCPKCRFVALILAPFLPPPDLHSIFGRDMLTGEIAPFLRLAGLGGHKPLDCIGEVAETRFAISQIANSPSWQESKFARRLRDAVPESQMPTTSQINEILSPSDPVGIPPGFASILDR